MWDRLGSFWNERYCLFDFWIWTYVRSSAGLEPMDMDGRGICVMKRNHGLLIDLSLHVRTARQDAALAADTCNGVGRSER